MGTTIAAASLVADPVPGRTGPEPAETDRSGQVLVVANVGDSRVYLLRGGELRLLSSDHSRVADLVTAGEIRAEEAIDHPERHTLTRVVGIEPDVEPRGVPHRAGVGRPVAAVQLRALHRSP